MFSANSSQVSNNAANYIEDVFSTYLYTGNGSTQTITNGIDLAGKGGLVWKKQRETVSGGYANHTLTDTARGAGYSIFSDTTDQQYLVNSLSSFNSNGFSIGNSGPAQNVAGKLYASWTFRKQPKFFDVVTYTGNGTVKTVNHNLGSVPGVMIVKCTSAAGENWAVYHRSLGATKYLELNNTNAASTSVGSRWDAEPTSTSFSVGYNGSVNSSGATYVAYIFAHNAGGFGLTGTDNVISCGSFTTDGSNNASVTLGYEPQWILTKSVSGVSDWTIVDNMRGMPVSGNGQVLAPNTSAAEASTSYNAKPNATGFTFNFVNSSNTFIYIAIRRGPMKVPTSGTSVFATQATRDNGTAGGNSFTSGFPVDLMIQMSRAGSDDGFQDRLRGFPQVLDSDSTAVEYGPSSFKGDRMTGVYGAAANSNWGAELFRRAPSFFDEVCYAGTGSAHTETHNLSAVPELIIVKRRNISTANWAVYHKDVGNTKSLFLNLTNTPSTNYGYWNDTTPTSSVFTVGNITETNGGGGYTYVAWLFATCAGVSKVGSYTGNGSTQTINCGFTGGARFVLIKRTDSTGDWWVWDTSRGMVSGNDPRLALNLADSEVNENWVVTNGSGFQIITTDASVNASGGTYIFLAIA